MVSLHTMVVLIMEHLTWLIFHCNNNLLQDLKQWLLVMVNNCLLLILVVVSCVFLLIILGLMVHLEFISFFCKTMLSVILILTDFLFRIYLRGRSNTLLKSRYWGLIMVENILILSLSHFFLTMLHSIKLLIHIPLNRMAFQRENIGIL